MACRIYNNIHHPSKREQTFVVSKIKSSQNGRMLFVPTWETGPSVFLGVKSDISWLYTLLAMMGELFDYGDEICGAVVNVRTKQEKIALWTKNAANEAAQLRIGRHGKSFGVTRIPWVSYSMKRQRGLTEVPRIVTLCSCLRTRRGTRNT